MAQFENILNILNGYVWSNAMLVLILGASLYFTIGLRFTQVRNFKDMLHSVTRTKSSESGISTLASFWASMGSRVGIGNIAGVATAIYVGGPGALFWMWVTSIVDAATSFTEVSLSQLYKDRIDNEYRGGTPYYAFKGMGWKWFGNLFALVTLIAMLFLVPGVQANMISEGMSNSLGIPYWVTGVVGAAILAGIVLGGIKRISKATSVMVPFMLGAFLLVVVIVLAMNIANIPAMFGMIFQAAFNGTSAFGGLMGAAIAWGVKRAIYSSGSGFGSETPLAAAAECAHPAQQGLANSIAVYLDAIIYTSTGLMILASDTFNTAGGYIGSGSAKMGEFAEQALSGVVFAQEAVGTVLPGLGQIVIALCVLFFAFTSILSYVYQAETALAFLAEKASATVRKNLVYGVRIITPLVYLYFSVATSSAAWGAGDLGFGLMTWLNMILLVIMFPKASALLKDYEAQRKIGKIPYFDPDKLGMKNADLWKEINKKQIAAEKAGK